MHINARPARLPQPGRMTTNTASPYAVTSPSTAAASPSTAVTSPSLARGLALAATACLVAMVAITFATGVSQEHFEMVRPLATYGADLARAAPSLRAIIAVDTLFLSLYALFFVVFARVVGEGNILLRLGVAAIVVTAALDAVEDHHILAMAAAALDGRMPSAAAVDAQQWLSQVKFNVSYFGLLAFGLGLPRRTRLERAFAWSIALVLPLLGSLIWAMPLDREPPLDAARWAAFVAGFVGALVLLRRR